MSIAKTIPMKISLKGSPNKIKNILFPDSLSNCVYNGKTIAEIKNADAIEYFCI